MYEVCVAFEDAGEEHSSVYVIQECDTLPEALHWANFEAYKAAHSPSHNVYAKRMADNAWGAVWCVESTMIDSYQFYFARERQEV